MAKIALTLVGVVAFFACLISAVPQRGVDFNQGLGGQNVYGPFGQGVSQGPGGQEVWSDFYGTYVRQGQFGQEILDPVSRVWVSQSQYGQNVNTPYGDLAQTRYGQSGSSY